MNRNETRFFIRSNLIILMLIGVVIGHLVFEHTNDRVTVCLIVTLSGVFAAFYYLFEKHRTDAQIEKNRERDRLKLSILTDSLNHLIFIEERTPGGINFYNKRFKKYLGEDPALDPAFWRRVVHPDDIERLWVKIRQARETDTDYSIEYRLRRHDGVYRWHLLQSNLLLNSQGIGEKWISSWTDIHDQKVAESERTQEHARRMAIEQESLTIQQSNQYLESLIDQIPYLIFTKDVETMKYVQVNQAVVDNLKVPAKTLIGKTARELYLPEQAALIEKSDREVAESGKTLDLPHHEITQKNIGTRIYSTRKFIMKQANGRKLVVGISHDLTDIIHAKEQAEMVARMKSEFLATMSHEIRTPLNGVLGMADLVLEGQMNEQQQKYMEILKDSGNTLLAIVNDILDFSKAEAGQLTIEAIPFDVRKVFSRRLELVKMRANAKDLAFSFHFDEKIPQFLSGDPNRISQVLFNLIGNAIKFTDQGGIVVHIELEERADQQVKLFFSIKDTGIGISPKNRASLFKPFVQADGSMARRYGGTGLGLSICKRLVELMQGQIDLTSNEGAGSTFWFTVNLQLAQALQTPLPPVIERRVLPRAARTKHILIAEDNKTNQMIADAIVTRMGYTTHIVANGQEAVEAMKKTDFDLILMDCQMPELDGYGATVKIREHEKATQKHIPIVAFTANALSEDKDKCLSAGMDDFIAKPIKRGALEEVLNLWIKSA